MSTTEAEQLLDQLEQDLTGYEHEFSRARVFASAQRLFEAAGDTPRAQECECEQLVFLVHGTDSAKPRERFVPEWVLADGTSHPDLSALPARLQEYLTRRLQETKNPIHLARYADFLWDRYRDAKSARLAIGAYIQCATIYRSQAWDMHIWDALRRAAQLAKLLKAQTEIPTVVAEVMTTLNEMEQAGRLFLISRVAEVLLNFAKHDLTQSQPAADIVRRTADSFKQQKEFHAQRFTLEDLSALHKALGQADKAHDVLVEIGDSYELEADHRTGDSNIAAGHFYGLAIHHNIGIGNTAPLESLKRKMQEANRKALESEMKSIESSFQISKEHLDEFAHQYVEDGLEIALLRIGSDFVPKLDVIAKSLERMQQQFIFYRLLSPSPMNAQGNIVAAPRTDKEAEEYYFIEEMVREITLTAVVYLQAILEHLKQEVTLTAGTMMGFLNGRLLFRNRDTRLLAYGLERYFSNDYVGALHVLVPQLEATIRHLLQIVGVATTSVDSEQPGVTTEKTFGTLLSTPELLLVLGPDAIKYLRVVLTDSRGLNLRNEIAHGLCSYEKLDQKHCEIIIQIFMLLSLIHEVPEPDQS